jgi:hypothetical protein
MNTPVQQRIRRQEQIRDRVCRFINDRGARGLSIPEVNVCNALFDCTRDSRAIEQNQIVTVIFR